MIGCGGGDGDEVVWPLHGFECRTHHAVRDLQKLRVASGQV
jgi:hypothetical protein